MFGISLRAVRDPEGDQELKSERLLVTEASIRMLRVLMLFISLPHNNAGKKTSQRMKNLQNRTFSTSDEVKRKS